MPSRAEVVTAGFAGGIGLHRRVIRSTTAGLRGLLLPSSTPGEVTTILQRINAGEDDACVMLVSLLYDELRALAARQMRQERWDHTLEPTALVNEAFIRLLGDQNLRIEDRAHFFGAAAEVMRRILVDHARKKLAEKRGGGRRAVALDEGIAWREVNSEDMLAIDEALTRLAEIDPEKSRIVELRYFAGLSVEETAALLGVSARTVKRKWRFAKAWLYREIGGA